jgi:hypothetical protein
LCRQRGNTGLKINEAVEPLKKVMGYERARATMPWAGRGFFQRQAENVAYTFSTRGQRLGGTSFI